MQRKNSRAPIFILIVFLAAAGYFGYRYYTDSQTSSQLKASGTIESVEVNVSPQTSGKVKEVLADEGQSVKAGDPLLRLDDSLLTAQQAAAKASLDTAIAGAQAAENALNTAKAQYQITLTNALAQDQPNRLRDWFSKDPKQFDQPAWYFTREEQIQAAQAQIDSAQQALKDAQDNLTKVEQSLEVADFLKAEQRLLNARIAYVLAEQVNNKAQNSTSSNQPVGQYNSTHCGTNQGYQVDNQRLTNFVYGCNGDPQLSNAGQSLYDNALAELNAAQQAYDDLLSSKGANEVLTARAQVSTAQEYYYSALDFLRSLQTGDQSPSVAAAQSAVDQAQAAADQAQKAVSQAQANLDLINTQISQLTIVAPIDGVVLARNVEPGEFVQPGGDAFTMANLSELTITVYVPEDRYGQIHLGQTAKVSVDSFPGKTFTATVTYISNQAEFTPRNVQTVEGRSATVYAIKMNVDDPNGDLKIGMPADVVFE